jgi:hypothetical protein
MLQPTAQPQTGRMKLIAAAAAVLRDRWERERQAVTGARRAPAGGGLVRV